MSSRRFRTKGCSEVPDEVFLWEGRLRVEVRREKRRGIRLFMRPEGVLDVRAPAGAEIKELLERRKRWIGRRLAAIDEVNPREPAGDHLLLYRGGWYPMRIGDRCRLPSNGDQEVIYTSLAALKRLMRKELREEVVRLVDIYARRAGVRWNRISIRHQRTRWGSCSGRGGLSFNLALIALPSQLREYVVIHEIAHLVEKNHSYRYWKLVERLCPGYRRTEQELKGYWLMIERNRAWQMLRTISDGKTDAR